MRSRSLARLACGLVLAALAGPSPARAASPFDGTWSVQVVEGVAQINLCIIKVEDKDGKPTAQLVAVVPIPAFKGATIGDVKGDAGKLQLDLKAAGTVFRVTARAPREGGKSKGLRGSLEVNGQVVPAVLEPTDKKEIGQADAFKPVEGGAELQKLQRETDAGKQAAGLKEVLRKYDGKPVEMTAARMLLQAEVKGGAKAADLKKTADRYLAAARSFGPEIGTDAVVETARELTKSKDGGELALGYVREAVAVLGKEEPTARTLPLFEMLAAGLRKAGKTDEADAVSARVARAEERLDQEFLKTAVPFETKPFAGRKGKSDRVVLVELFTGAQCPPCVAADVAFDAAVQSYKPGDVALLEHHLHIPGPDPLTNADTEARQEYYGDQIPGTPTAFADGKATPALGGPKGAGQASFDRLSGVINEALEKAPGAELKLSVERKGDKLELAADVSGLKEVGDKTRLRFVLAEDVVRYPGRNRQRLHHHVVRSFPGGVAGIPLKEKSGKHTVTVSLPELRKTLEGYLDKSGRGRPYLDDARPLELRHLMVVAFVQDDATKQVLQAAQAEVPGEK
jgi:hypothetical protein